MIFPAMDGQQKPWPPPVNAGKARRLGRRQRWVPAQPRLHQMQGIDAGIAGDVDGGRRDAFRLQGCCRRHGWREMDIRQLGDHPAVQFFRKRFGMAGSQPGFDMHQRSARIGRGLCRRQRAGGVPLHQHRRRLPGLEQLRQRRDQRADNIRRRLAVAHDREVDIGSQPEVGQRVGQQFAMLAGRHQQELPAAAAQFENHRGKLERFRPGPGNGNKSVT